jgi:hypothetical protein
MMIRLWPFNLYFLAALLLWTSGCASSQKRADKKQLTAMRLHLEGRRSGLSSYQATFRTGLTLDADPSPKLSDYDLSSVTLVDSPTGFAIQLQFNDHGRLVLDNITSAYRGKRLLIFAQWDQGRWIAAPQMNQRISSGVLVFTPDTSREEAERIILGLNNAIKKNK